MSDLTITTNGHVRELLAYSDLTALERDQFNYIAGDENEHYTPRFFRYRGYAYDVHEFSRIYPRGEIRPGDVITFLPGSPLAEWSAAQPDSYFSGVLIRYTNIWSESEFDNTIVVGSWSE